MSRCDDIDPVALRAECNALRAERDQLRTQVADLESRFAASERLLDRSNRLLHYLTEYAPTVIYVKDVDGRFLLSNRRHAELLERSPVDIVGCTEHDLLAPDEADQIAAVTAIVLATGESVQQEFCLELADGPRWFLEQIYPLYGSDGTPFAVAGLSTDVTDTKRLEYERARLQERVIAAQNEAIDELSAPLLQLTPDVLAVPLIGRYDHRRSDRLLDVLSHGVVEYCARFVLLDLTGLHGIDRATADTIDRLTRVVQLLGAHLVITGVTAPVAKILAQSELSFDAITIARTLGDGLIHLLQESGGEPNRSV